MRPVSGGRHGESHRQARHADAEDSLEPIMNLGGAHRSLSITLALLGALLMHGTAGARAASALYEVGDFAQVGS